MSAKMNPFPYDWVQGINELGVSTRGVGKRDARRAVENHHQRRSIDNQTRDLGGAILCFDFDANPFEKRRR